MKMVNRNNTTAWKIICALMVIAIATTITMDCLAAGGLSKGSTAYVNVDTYLNLRKEPQGEIIGQAPRGEKVTILSGPDRNHYYFIRVQSTGLECYAYGEFLTAEYIEKASGKKVKTVSQEETAHTETKKATKKYEPKELHYDMSSIDELEEYGRPMFVISDARLNLRKGPSFKKARIRFLKHGEIVIVTDEKEQNGFVKVIAASDGKEGYVYKSYLSENPPEDVYYIFDNLCPCQYEDLSK